MIDQTVINDALKRFYIPPRPEILVEISAICRSEDPNISVLAELIGRDVALAGAVLRIINSPFYGFPTKIDDIQQAAMMLGTKGIESLVTGHLLRKYYSGKKACISLERFWEERERSAKICFFIGDRTDMKRYVPLETLYTIGLFFNAGIAAFAIRFSDYRELLELANNNKDVELSKLEQQRYQSDHATVGYILARTWGLPDSVSEVILEHNNNNYLAQATSMELKMSWACICMTRNILSNVRSFQDIAGWKKNAEQVFEIFGIDEADYLDLKDDVQDIIQAE